jgi:RimJ/RimL family protein N-acetyltransferase
VDSINKRSLAAVLKLGCTQEGIMRAERVTWTGRLRHTVLFSILAEEWQG